MPFLGWVSSSRLSSLREQVAVFGEVDESGWVPRIGTPAFSHGFGEVQRGLAAELHDDAMQGAVLLFGLEDLDDVFFGQRLEIEAVGGVVVGRDGFRVAVDHDGLVAGIAQREGGVAAAIVELDALADAVRAAAEDHHLLAVGRARLVGHARRQTALRRSSTCRRWARRIRRRRCRCACRPGGRRANGAARARRSACTLASSARRASEKPMALSAAQRCRILRQAELADLVFGLDDALASARGTTGRSCRRRGCPRATEPSRMASATCSRRSGVGVRDRGHDGVLVVVFGAGTSRECRSR